METRSKYFVPFADDGGTDSFDFLLYSNILIDVLTRHSTKDRDSIKASLYRLCGYVCSGKMDVSGGVPQDTSTGSATDTD